MADNEAKLGQTGTQRAIAATARAKFGMRDLWRMALWGLSASAALTLVAYAGTTDGRP